MKKLAYGYVRQSTQRQANSGLSAAAQTQSIQDFAKAEGFELVEIKEETGSGGDNDRPVLKELLRLAKANNAYIVISKLDRLSRRVSYISSLMEAHVAFVTVEFGSSVDPFLLHIYSAVAEQQRRYISERTKLALAQSTKQLGNPRWSESVAIARQAQSEKADAYAASTMVIIQELRSVGVTSLRGLAKALNLRGIQTRRGGSFHPTTVRNLLKRVEARQEA